MERSNDSSKPAFEKTARLLAYGWSMTSAGSMPEPEASNDRNRQGAIRREVLQVVDETTGIAIDGADSSVPFVELGFDSLSLTQLAIQIRQTYKVELTFRQLMESQRTLDSLVEFLVEALPEAPTSDAVVLAPELVASEEMPTDSNPALSNSAQLSVSLSGAAASPALIEQVISQQMVVMSQQLALLCGVHRDEKPPFAAAPIGSTPQPEVPKPTPDGRGPQGGEAPDKESAKGIDGTTQPDAKQAFGAIARIHTDADTRASEGQVSEGQRLRLDAFIRRYTARTKLSKAYTQTHRSHLADPRVVNGFAPLRKEITYQLIAKRSEGSHLWDLDGNKYIDALNGFGMSLFGWQPEFVVEAITRQIGEGYEIGPQHPLAGEVAEMVCGMTGFDRVGFCNTGSEAVMGAMRVARTVTGRRTIVIFTGSYHGIFDEVVVRATSKLRAFPAAPGIMPTVAHNVLVLDYGTPESLQIIKSRAHELAAVLVEPVQSRRPEFQPRDFLRELRDVTQEAGVVLIFDEVVTGFRCHPGGIQALFGVQADLCTYGKVLGGGFPIGVIAGKRDLMDALDGGAWQYGDDSIPTVGVTYFAGTFVRHPLALAAAKATLTHLKQRGPELQAELTRVTSSMIDGLNAFCQSVGAPIRVVSFASMWRINFDQEHPLQDLLFAMMRFRGVHILDSFPCFMTTAHSGQDIAQITTAFQESVTELQDGGFLPRRQGGAVFDIASPPVPGARIGKDQDGNAAWFVPNPESPGKYLRLDG